MARWFALCPGKQAEQDEGKKLRHLPHPLSEVEGSGGHEQVDGVTEHAFQEILGHSVIMLDMPNHRLNGGSPAETHPGLAPLAGGVTLFRSVRRQDFRVTHPCSTPIPPVADGHLGTGFGDLPDLLQNIGQRIAVIDVFRKGQRPDDDTRGFGHDQGSFAAKLVFLGLLALADAQHIRLVQAVDLVPVSPLLLVNFPEKLKRFSMPCQGLARELAFQFADEHSGHRPDAFDDPIALEALEQQARQLPPEATAQADAFIGSDLPASLDAFCQELRVGGEGDVFFLDSGVHRDFRFLGVVTMQRHRDLKDQARSLFADPFAKIDEVRGIAGKLPLEMSFATKGLKVGIGHLGLDHPLVAQILKLLEQDQADHEPDRLGWASGLAIEPGEFVLEALPRDALAQFEQGMGGIELLQKVRIKEIALPTFAGFCLHDRPQKCSGATGFLRNHCSSWLKTIY